MSTNRRNWSVGAGILLVCSICVSNSVMAQADMFSTPEQAKKSGVTVRSDDPLINIPGLTTRRVAGTSTVSAPQTKDTKVSSGVAATAAQPVVDAPKQSGGGPQVVHTYVPTKPDAVVAPRSVKTTKITTSASDPLPTDAVTSAPLPSAQKIIDDKLREALAKQMAAVTEGAPRLIPSGGVANSGEGKNTITVRNGVTEIIYISKQYLTRFETPYQNPEIKTINDAEAEVVGNTVYLTPQSDSTIGLFIYNRDNPSDSMSLQLVPQEIPQRDISLRVAGRPPMGSATQERLGIDQPYTTFIMLAISELAKGRMPAGYSLSAPRGDEVSCEHPGVKVELGQLVEGATYRIAVFAVTNTSDSTVSLNEDYCYRNGVVAAAFWPRTLLEPRAQSELYVMLKYDQPQDLSSARPSLISQ